MKKGQLFTEMGKWIIAALALLLLLVFIISMATEINILGDTLFGRGF